MYGNGPVSGGTLAAAGYANTLKVNAPETHAQSATERIRSDLEGAINRVHSAIDRVRLFTSAMQGEGGAQGVSAEKNPQRSGNIGAIQDRVDHLHASLSTLENELERLTAI